MLRKSNFQFSRHHSYISQDFQMLSALNNCQIHIWVTIMITCPCNVHPLTPHFYIYSKTGFQGYTFLAHLSRRLIGELIGYSWSGVRPSSFTMLKDFLQNSLANQSQILCAASLGRGTSLFAASGSHDQDGRHAHICQKPFKNIFLQNRRANFHETWYVASGTPAHHNLFK